MHTPLNWPQEPESPALPGWNQPGSNICLDFHGDPATADLVVFSDGNHHMALAQTVARFRELNPDMGGIFYATTPPSVIMGILQDGQIRIGNLILSRQPHVFISPEFILQKVVSLGRAQSYQAFMQSIGNVLLVRKSNPKKIKNIHDLLRDDVTLFLSNPKTESASYQVYRNTLLAIAPEHGIDRAQIEAAIDPAKSSVVYGERIHHREAPQTVADGVADVAVVYYHLALRYQRIFPDTFSFVTLTGAGDNRAPANETGNEQTPYFITTMNDPGKYGKAFVEFCFRDEVTEIYKSHGLKRPD